MTYRLLALPLLAALATGLLLLVATLAAPLAFAGEPTCSA